MIVGRDTERLDRHGMARAAIESVAENLTDGVFSTLFWAAARQPGWGLLRRGLCRADAPRFQYSGRHVGKKERPVQTLRHLCRTHGRCSQFPTRPPHPAVHFPGGSLREENFRPEGAHHGWAFRRAHASPNSAWSEAAFAGALGLRIGGRSPTREFLRTTRG